MICSTVCLADNEIDYRGKGYFRQQSCRLNSCEVGFLSSLPSEDVYERAVSLDITVMHIVNTAVIFFIFKLTELIASSVQLIVLYS